MTQLGIPPDNFAFPAVLKAVAGLQDLNLGKQIHAHVFKFGYASSWVTVANSLVNLYGKCGDVGDVYKVFERITDRDQVSWNSAISALCRFQEWELALEAFRLMLFENVVPSSFTLVSVALACSNLHKHDGLRLGKQVHAYSLRTGNWRTYTNNALMSMYAKLGKVDDSRSLFELFEDRDLVSWNTMISLLSQNDQFLKALLFLRLMVLKGIVPDGVTFASVLPACSHLEMLDRGKEIHAYALKNTDLVENSFVGCALVDMYCNCQQVESGRRVFDGILERNIAIFNAMITGYAQNEHDEKALDLFFQMVALDGIRPNATTMSSVLPACVSCELFSDTEGMHGYVIKRGLDRDKYVQNALMDMYSRMGKIEISKYIFNCMEQRDIVSWNTLITGYVISGCHDHALNLLNQMQRVELERYGGDDCVDENRILKPNSVTLMTVLPGCSVLAALAKGKEIHAYAVRHLLASDVAVGSALVDIISHHLSSMAATLPLHHPTHWFLSTPKLKSFHHGWSPPRPSCSFLADTQNQIRPIRATTEISQYPIFQPPQVEEESSSELESADPDFYKIGYVRSMRAYGVDFKEGPDGFGVYASKDVEPLRRARVIMEIPLELMLTISQKLPWMFFPDIIPLGHPIFDIINSTNPETDWDLRLACLLLYAFDREDNFWQLYGDFLPSAEECTSLLLATEEELLELQDPKLALTIREQQHRALEFWEKNWHSGVPLKIKRLARDPERFIWAVGIVQSRCLNMQLRIGALVQDTSMLVPYADMLNHSFQPNCFLHWRFKDRMLEVMINAGQRIKKGDEMTINYFSGLKNDMLMQRYGFSSPVNPWDVIQFSGNARIHLDSFLSVFNIAGLPEEYYHNSRLSNDGDTFVDGAVIAAARTVPTWSDGDVPPIPSLERKAVKELQEECQQMLAEFPTNSEQDQKLLGKGKHGLSPESGFYLHGSFGYSPHDPPRVRGLPTDYCAESP
nr:protein plastid transcriptionally active 14 [Quercus suber]